MTSAKQQANDVATALSSTGNGESESSYDTLLARLSHHAQESPSKVAVTYLESGAAGGKEKVSLTYRQLDQQTTNLAQQLLLQINKKETTSQRPMAVLVYPPSLDFMVAFLACVKAGIVAVPVFPPNPTRKDTLAMFCKIVANCQATIALTNTSYNHMKKVASIQQVLQLKKQQAVSWPEQLRWITTDTLLDAPKEAVALPPIQANVTPSSSSIDTLDNVVFLQYTSGSTSDPKGVMITQTNLAHNLTIITNELQAHQDTVVVSWLPQYHDMGLIGVSGSPNMKKNKGTDSQHVYPTVFSHTLKNLFVHGLFAVFLALIVVSGPLILWWYRVLLVTLDIFTTSHDLD